jgi:hypothetical protein
LYIGFAKALTKSAKHIYICLQKDMLFLFFYFSKKKLKNNMTTQKINLRFTVITSLILLAAASRLLPIHNFSPLGAIALFGAAHFAKKWQAIVIPLLATWLSDLFINNVIYARFYPTFTWFYDGFYWQYASYILIAVVAFFILKKVNVKNVLIGALSSTVIFFVISNFGVWMSSTAYPHTFSGLMACYTAAIPFANGSLTSDLFYAAILFGSFALAQKQLPVLKLAHA